MPDTQPGPAPLPRKRRRLWRLLRLPLTLLACLLLVYMGLYWWGHHPEAAHAGTPRTTPTPKFPRYKLSAAEKRALLARRKYLLGKVLRASAGTTAQPSYIPPQFQGEWALVTNSMLGVALANLAYLMPGLRTKSQAQLDRLIAQTLRKELRRFDHQRWGHNPLDLRCKHGHIGYLGHLNMLLAARHSLGGKSPHSRLFHQVSAALVRKLKQRKSWIADTYPGERYTSDHAVVIGSLALYDRFFPARATGFGSQWLTKMRRCCHDPRTGLLAFQVSTQGKPTSPSRGSGAAWDLYYLSHVNLRYTRKQFKKFKRHFVQKVFFVTGVREWAKGTSGSGDIDSGPLIFGLSPAGTGFGIGITRLAGDGVLLNKLLTTADLGGISMRHGKKRYYLLAPLVGEAALLAMRTAIPWDRRYQKQRNPPSSQPLRRGSTTKPGLKSLKTKRAMPASRPTSKPTSKPVKQQVRP